MKKLKSTIEIPVILLLMVVFASVIGGTAQIVSAEGTVTTMAKLTNIKR